MFSITPKATETLLKELIAQKLGEYYFLDAADCYVKESEGYIVLLRSMQTITMVL